jgi:hypothetical protein
MEHNTNKKSSAIESWQLMKNLLNAEEAVHQTHTHNNKRQYSVLVLLLLMLSCGTYKLLQKNQAIIVKNNEVNIKKNAQKNYSKSPIVINEPNALNTIQNKSHTNQNKSHTNQNKSYSKQNKFHTNQNNSYTNQNKPHTIQNKSYTNQNNSYTIQNKYHTNQNNSYTTSFNSTNNQYNTASKTKDSITQPPLNDTSSIPQKTNSPSNTTISHSSKNNKKNTTPLPFSYGLEWVLPYTFNNTSFANNTLTANPILSLLPSIWIARNITSKSSVAFKCNPYSQHILNNVSLQNQLVTAVQTASNSINNTNKLLQTITFYKLMGIEISAAYQYKLSNQFTATIGIGNTFVSSAMVNDVVTKNSTEKTKDNLSNISKNDVNWKNITSHFLTTQLALEYNFKKYNVGVRIIQPVTSLYNNNTYPINYQAVFKLKFL